MVFDSFFHQKKIIQYFYKPLTTNITIQLSKNYNIRAHKELESGTRVNFRLILPLCEIIRHPDIKIVVVLGIQLLRRGY